MIRHVLVVLAALVFSASLAQAQPKVEQAPIKQTPASDAQAMFTNYCAVCHGATGVGDGPAASALAKAPADLTHLSSRNGGQFPETQGEAVHRRAGPGGGPWIARHADVGRVCSGR